MKCIASYYIKTLFLWKVEKVEKSFWKNKLSIVFREMVNEFYEAIKNKNIPYFWDQNNNLIENIKPSIQSLYADKLKSILNSIDSNDVDKTTYALLTIDEKNAFKNSEFYKEQELVLSRQQSISSASPSRQLSVTSNSEVDSGKSNRSVSSEVDSFRKSSNLEDIVKCLVRKVEALTIQVKIQSDRIRILEEEGNIKGKAAKGSEPNSQNDELSLLSDKTVLLDLCNDSNMSFTDNGGSQSDIDSVPIVISQDLVLL